MIKNKTAKENIVMCNKKIGVGLAIMILGGTIEGIIGYILLILGLIIVVLQYYKD